MTVKASAVDNVVPIPTLPRFDSGTFQLESRCRCLHCRSSPSMPRVERLSRCRHCRSSFHKHRHLIPSIPLTSPPDAHVVSPELLLVVNTYPPIGPCPLNVKFVAYGALTFSGSMGDVVPRPTLPLNWKSRNHQGGLSEYKRDIICRPLIDAPSAVLCHSRLMCRRYHKG